MIRWQQLIKLGEIKKALNIYKEAQIISPSKTQSQIGSIPFVYNKIFTLPSTENPN